MKTIEEAINRGYTLKDIHKHIDDLCTVIMCKEGYPELSFSVPTRRANNLFRPTPSISIYDFSFIYSGPGHYLVTYTSPATGKKWARTVDDMSLIDATKNSEQPKVKDLKRLKTYVKNILL